jgi:hypothetical protein
VKFPSVEKQEWLTKKWGNLTLNPNQDLPSDWSMGSRKRFIFNCSCGRVCTSIFNTVALGKSKSCGRCLFKSKEYWLSQAWGKLKLDSNQDNLPDEWGSSSNRMFQFICNCGRRYSTLFYAINNQGYTSCGHCNDKPKEYWLTQKWGKLRLDPHQDLPDEWGRGNGSYTSYLLICNCGRSTKAKLTSIFSGNTKSCGHCNDKPKEYWLDQTWGDLTLDPNQDLPDEWGRGSRSVFLFSCLCGNSLSYKFYAITHCSTCNKCNTKDKAYWLQQTWGKLKIDPNQELPDEWSHGGTVSPIFICSCGRKTSPLFRDVYNGKTRSCGCGSTGQSEFSPENEVRLFVQSLESSTLSNQYPIEGTRKSYDIYVPSKKLAIEYHGLVWHSERYHPEKKDYEKLTLAKQRGDRLIQIYSDEWRDKQEIMKEMLASLLTHPKGKRIKPTFSLEYTTSKEARTFLDAHHYLGAASGCLTVIARYGEAIVGVWVFMKREEGVILWHRACVDHKFKMWNPHEKVLHLALPELKKMGFKKMITFSDNRFHTGQLYEKLGFKFEKELNPDYGYTDGTNRVSKYNLRVKAGINEKASAQAKGWYRIWDSGKKRFSFPLVEYT